MLVKHRTVREGQGPHAERERWGGVGPWHSTDEPTEQSRFANDSGGWGGKAKGQGELFIAQHAPDTERGRHVPGVVEGT